MKEAAASSLGRGDTQRLKCGIRAGREAAHLVHAVVELPKSYRVLEVFSGMSEVTMQAIHLPGWEALQPFELTFGDDLRRRSVQQACLSEIDLMEPDLVVLEPPCGPWCQLQSLNDPLKVAEKQEEHRPLWHFTRRVWNAQDRRGGLVLTEQPHTSRALQLPEMRNRPHLCRAIRDQCQDGLRDPVSRRPYRKRTALDSNDEVFRDGLERGGRCTHHPEEHETIIGSVRVNGKTVSRSAWAARYTPAFCRVILKAAERALEERARVAEAMKDIETHSVAHVSYLADHVGLCDEISAEVAWVFASTPVESRSSSHTSGSDPDAARAEPFEEAVRKEFSRLQAEEDERRGDVRTNAARYGYISFRGAGLRLPQRTRNALAKLHGVLCHPSNERLARMLLLDGASPEIVAGAKDLVCMICARLSAPGAAPQVSAKKPQRFNEECLMDTFYVWLRDGSKWAVTHILCGFCTQHGGDVNKDASSQHAADVLNDRWVAVFGPMQRVQVDAGTEFRGHFEKLCRMLNVMIVVIPPSNKWKHGLCERHGAILKLMLLRVVWELGIVDEWELRYALSMALSAKNKMLRKCGYSPLQVVTGQDTLCPAALADQLASGQTRTVANHDATFDVAVNRMERIRAQAVSAFAWLDSHETLRRGLCARSHPPALAFLTPGTEVIYYKQQGATRRLHDLMEAPQGPCVVVAMEGVNNVWLRDRGTLVKVALENVRLANEEDLLGNPHVLKALEDMESELTGQRRPFFDDLTPERESPAGAPEASEERVEVPPVSRRLRAKTRPENIPEALEGVRHIRGTDPEIPVDPPAPVEPVEERVEPSLRDSGVGSHEASRRSRSPPVTRPARPEAEPFAARREFFESGAREWRESARAVELGARALLPSSGDASSSSAIPLAETPLRRRVHLSSVEEAARLARTLPEEGEEAGDEPPLKVARTLDEHSALAAMVSPGAWVEDLAALARTSCAAFEVLATPEEVPEEKVREELIKDTAEQETSLDEIIASGGLDAARGGPRAGAGSGELNYRDHSARDQAALADAMVNQFQKHVDLCAVAKVPVEEAVDQASILPSRMVLTKKTKMDGSPDFRARWCGGGHRDPRAGEYESYSPTALMVGHAMVLFLTVTLRLTLFVCDVSSAFLQGEDLPIDRKLFMRVPNNLPKHASDYVRGWAGPGFRSDVVRIIKGIFGLSESPRLWYERFRKVLRELGFREMKLFTCVFVLWHRTGELAGRIRALMSIHVDDGLAAGDDTAEPVWTDLRARLTFGNWEMVGPEGRKFCGKVLSRTSPTVIEWSLNHYTVDIPLVTIASGRDPASPLSPSELTELMRGNGAVGYAAKHGRHDLAYGVSRCQQSTPVATVETLLELNQLIRRARQPAVWRLAAVSDDIMDIVFLAASDAALGAMPRDGSQAGMACCVGHPSVLDGPAPTTLLESSSQRIKRSIRSSMGVEIAAAGTALEHGEFLRCAFAEMVFCEFSLRRWREWACRWRLVLVVDAKCGFDSLNGLSPPQDRRVAIDVAALKETLSEPANQATARWLPGPQHVADALTKRFGNAILKEVMETNVWSLRETPEVRAERDRLRTLRKEAKAARERAP